ncbi:hypothetical protein HOY82DRAFT_537826 [Tuber indicum]|nr:hypothetical protein HOY82DRAFT_537826 [Tuber indicum]
MLRLGLGWVSGWILLAFKLTSHPAPAPDLKKLQLLIASPDLAFLAAQILPKESLINPSWHSKPKMPTTTVATIPISDGYCSTRGVHSHYSSPKNSGCKIAKHPGARVRVPP